MFKTIADIKKANAKLGNYWFSPDTMRFFKSKIHNRVFFGKYFITSEQFSDASPRMYTIRKANADGSIDTVGIFQQYKTLSDAIEAVTTFDR